jgi:hypothetical protein
MKCRCCLTYSLACKRISTLNIAKLRTGFVPTYNSLHLVCSIAFEGRLLVIGFASGDIPKIPANLLLVKSCSAVGIYWGSYSMREPAAFFESIQETSKYLQEGKIKPAVGKAFSLAEVMTEGCMSWMERDGEGKGWSRGRSRSRCRSRSHFLLYPGNPQRPSSGTDLNKKRLEIREVVVA